MPTTIEVKGYTPEELKTENPEAYAALCERWSRLNYESWDMPWSEETMDSLRAVVEACGGTLTDWSIGIDSGSCSVRVDDEDENGKPKDARWFRREVLKPKGHTKPNGHAHFPGLCVFTGYCADDAMLEAVYAALRKGDTLTEALEGLASVASRMMADDMEQAANEESMLANWGDILFTRDGERVRQ